MSHEIDRNETFCQEDLAVIINDFRSISHAYVKLLKDTDEDEQNTSEEERKKKKGERREKQQTL